MLRKGLDASQPAHLEAMLHQQHTTIGQEERPLRVVLAADDRQPTHVHDRTSVSDLCAQRR